MVIGCGSKISKTMKECANQPSVEGQEIEWIEVEINGNGTLEIPDEIDSAEVTDIEGIDYTRSKEINYILIPKSVSFEAEPDLFEKFGDAGLVVLSRRSKNLEKKKKSLDNPRMLRYNITADFEICCYSSAGRAHPW